MGTIVVMDELDEFIKIVDGELKKAVSSFPANLQAEAMEDLRPLFEKNLRDTLAKDAQFAAARKDEESLLKVVFSTAKNGEKTRN